MSNITLNIVEPGSGPTPDPVAPNTGLFTSGIGGPEATIITAVSAVLILTIATIVVAVCYRKQKKSGKVTKLVHLVDSTKAVLKSKKRVTAGLSAIALLASVSTLTTLLANAGKSNTSAVDGNDGLTLGVSSEDFTIEVGDSPVFAVLPIELTVKEATQAGYTLTAYTDNTDLVSTTNPDNIIPMVTLPESSVETLESSEATGELAALTDNTYGLALDEEPTTKDAEVYMPLSTDSSNPTILKAIDDYSSTPASDTTTIYYGFYITPDVPYGTYTGININYNIEPHYITNLSFNGNGNDGGETIEGITIIAGDTITLPENTFAKEGYNFIGWNTVAGPTEQDPGETYAGQADYTAELGETKDVTLYAQWEEDGPKIGDLTYMQDFASFSEAEKTSVLNSMTEGAEYKLEDNRDQTMYYIAKLADGNVWMTQNLDLDLISDPTTEGYVALTPANTNISEDWLPLRSTIYFTGTTVDGWQNDNNTPYSADPGDVYYYTSGTDEDDIQYNSLAECKAAGHTDCSHYHAGNYYNWSAAVASNNTAEIAEPYINVETSICPAGWRLPKNRNAESWTEGNEQDTMISSYNGIVGEPHSGCGGTCMVRDYLDGGFNKIRTAPLWLARSGGVKYGVLGAAGISGYYWSSTGNVHDNAYYQVFYSSYVNPASTIVRDGGQSVRCVAQ